MISFEARRKISDLSFLTMLGQVQVPSRKNKSSMVKVKMFILFQIRIKTYRQQYQFQIIMLQTIMSYETPKVVTVHNPQIGLLRDDIKNKNMKSKITILNKFYFNKIYSKKNICIWCRLQTSTASTGYSLCCCLPIVVCTGRYHCKYKQIKDDRY